MDVQFIKNDIQMQYRDETVYFQLLWSAIPANAKVIAMKKYEY